MDLNHGGLENLIMNVMWDNSENFEGLMSVNQEKEKLNNLNTNKTWAYTTVKTVLDRLTEKGMLDKVKFGKKFNYRTIMPKKEMPQTKHKHIILNICPKPFATLI